MKSIGRPLGLRAFLAENTVADVLQPDTTCQPILCLIETDTVGFALEQLAAAGNVSAPVLLKTAACCEARKASDDHRLFTSVLIADIIGFLDLNVVLQHFLRGAFESNMVHHTRSDIERIGDRFCASLVGDLLQDGISCHGASACDWALRGDESASLLSIIRECFLFAKPGSMKPPKIPARSIHRVAIHSAGDSPQRLVTVLSQSDLIRYVHDHHHEIGGPCHKAIKDLGLVAVTSAEVPPSPSTTSSESSERAIGSSRPQLVVVPRDMPALEAFRRMCMHRVSGVGVMHSDGTLMASLSATDLRCLAPGLFHALLLPVDDFLQTRPLLREVQAALASDGEGDSAPAPKRQRVAPTTPKGVITCQATSTLSEVAGIMASHDVHRVYVVDPDSKPVCAVTMTDVLRVLSEHSAALPRGAAGMPVPPPESVTSVASDRAASVTTSLQSGGCI